jgi:hypothetical protein
MNAVTEKGIPAEAKGKSSRLRPPNVRINSSATSMDLAVP